MSPRQNNKKSKQSKSRTLLHLNAAYALGKTARKASNAFKDLREKSRVKKRRVKQQPKTPEELVSPILVEIKAIADISGLTAAIQKMNEISLKHSRHPMIVQVISKIENLPPAEQEKLAKKFLDRLITDPDLQKVFQSFSLNTNISEETSQVMTDSFIGCISQTLEDSGLIREERKLLEKLTGEVAQPLNELTSFYLKPKTLSQKLKRLWRLQRIFIKIIGLAHKTNLLVAAAQNAQTHTYNNVIDIIPSQVPSEQVSQVSIRDTTGIPSLPPLDASRRY